MLVGVVVGQVLKHKLINFYLQLFIKRFCECTEQDNTVRDFEINRNQFVLIFKRERERVRDTK